MLWYLHYLERLSKKVSKTERFDEIEIEMPEF